MKKLLSFCFVMLLVLSGCESDEEKIKSGVNKIQEKLNTIISESEISDFIEGDIKFERYDTIISEEKTVFMYNIVIPMKASYLQLKPSEQYRLLKEPTQKIFDYQGDDYYGGPIGNQILMDYEANEERIKHESLILTFNKDDNYNISLNNEEAKEYEIDNNGDLSNVIFGTIGNEKYVILSTGELLHEDEYRNSENYALKDSTSDQSTQTPTQNTENGWGSLSLNQKSSMVSQHLLQLQNQGYTINVNEDYFIKSLDAYYEGNETDVTSIGEAIQMVGLAGGAITK
ncbi:hypothetical protein ACIQXU_16480 [Peribacillus sp. NPDC097284]|uniref:hypothetical protein n=1 Tax=Peribacillus sp. NPDC097284 TaxID=3364401 RepID=UPI0038124F99